MSDHRRQFERAKLDLPAVLEPRGGDGRPVVLGDLGPDGAFIAASIRVGLGDPVTIRFHLDNHPIPFEIDAEVRWQRSSGGFGIQFTGISGYDRSALDDYCQRRIELQRAGAR